jgi:hypothetical protein
MNTRQRTIAEQLHGRDESYSLDDMGQIVFDPTTLVYTFKDGSQAKLITSFNECEPYVTASLSTMSKVPVRNWKVV